MRFVQTLVSDGHYLLQYVPNVSAAFVSVFGALQARGVPSVGPVLGGLVDRIERMHPRVAAHAESPAIRGPVACQWLLLLQHLQRRRTVATTAAQLRSQTQYQHIPGITQ